MDRKPIFDAVRKMLGRGFEFHEVLELDDALDLAMGVVVVRPQARKASQKGIDLIHSFESLKLTSYKDPGSRNGLPITNGWGTTVEEDGSPIRLGAVWDKAKADRLFARDLGRFERAVAKLTNGVATQGQFDALVSFAYNAGEGQKGLAGSTLLKKHLAGDYAGAAEQFGRWVYNDGVPMRGLIRRRDAEAAMYQSKS